MNAIEFCFLMIGVLILSAMVGGFIKFLHTIIGSPSGDEYNDSMILSFYGRWVVTKYVNFENNRKSAEDIRSNPYKALGACLVCFGTWIALVVCLVAFLGLGITFWLYIPAATMSVYFAKQIEL